MPRLPNTRSTSIYWLVDTRTGQPFYCGKTVGPVDERLSDHRYTAAKFPNRKISRVLIECGENVRIDTVETVAVGDDWASRERHWIAHLRATFSDVANTSSGGDGPAGMVHSELTKEKIRVALKGRKMPPGHGAKVGAKTRGQKRTAETLARMSAARKGETRTPEQREKIRVTLTGRKLPAAHCAAISKANAGRKLSAAHCAAISAGSKGKTFSTEHRAKLSAAHTGRKHSSEHVESRASVHRGKPKSVEQRAKMSASQKGRPLSTEHRASLKFAWIRRKARLCVDNRET